MCGLWDCEFLWGGKLISRVNEGDTGSNISPGADLTLSC